MPKRYATKKSYHQGGITGTYSAGYGPMQISGKYDSRKLIKDVKMLKGLINTEFKFNDRLVSNNILDTGEFILMNGIAQGTNDNERIGNTMRIKSVEYRIIVQHNIGATDQTYFRCILFVDLESDGADPTLAEVLQNTTVPIVSPRNLNNRNKYLILKDQVLKLNDDNPNGYIEVYKKLNLKTTYDAAGATIAAIANHPIYLLVLSNHPSNGPTMNSYSRIRYVDN